MADNNVADYLFPNEPMDEMLLKDDIFEKELIVLLLEKKDLLTDEPIKFCFIIIIIKLSIIINSYLSEIKLFSNL
jgi:hypothetical protein